MSPDGSKPKRFRVALSFPGEHRTRVEAIAKLLAQTLGQEKVLYDNWYEEEFARPNLDDYLSRLYHEDAELIVFFLCEDYKKKPWCRLEWRVAKDLLFGQEDDRLMFLKVDATEAPGLYRGDGYMPIQGKPDEEVAAKILKRLGVSSGPVAKTYEAYVAKLPATDATLIGRDKELATLEEAWERGANLIQIIAPGGTGKTALMTKWYKRRVGEVPIYGWSFYRQGAGDNANVSSDEFLDAVVRHFNLAPKANTADAKVAALVHHLHQHKTLLILDGLEPLQNQTNGDLTDFALKDLLRELTVQNAGLVLCTTRVRLADVAEDEPLAPEIQLDNLTPFDGARLLREKFGVHGSEADLVEASEAYGNHALALTLLGTYLKRLGGDLSRRFEIGELPAPATKPGDHAKRVMQSYAKEFAGRPEGEILRGLGFFDRPAERAALKLVLPRPLDEEALLNLKEARLILTADARAPIDCHPLVRECFGAELRRSDPDAFCAGHSALFDHYCGVPEQDQPESLAQLTPLFNAVRHGCLADRYQEALDDVYRERIHHGDRGRHFVAYASKRLGAFGTNLSLLAHFFERPWSHLISGLRDAEQSWVLNEAAYSLRALGRLADAVEPMHACAQSTVQQQDWEHAAVAYGSLSELLLTLGRVAEAIASARAALEFADRSNVAFQRMARRTTLADALHQSDGSTSNAHTEALVLFAEAERIQSEIQPDYPLLNSLGGYRYSDFLLGDTLVARGDGAEVVRRATKTLAWAIHHLGPRDIGLDHITLGRAHLFGSPESAYHLEQALVYLRRAGQLDSLLLALLARATDVDLEEVRRIATRSGMRLFLTDYHLAMAKRHNSLEHLEKAEKLIEETGYHRRDEQAAALRKQLTV